MMKGTPCSSRRRATLKTLWKTHYLARSSNPAKRVRAWAASSHRSKDGPRKRKSIGSPQWRCNLFIEFAVPPWLDADEH